MKKDYRKGWFTHVHHSGPAIEWSDNIEERFEFIRASKAADEQELRAALIIRVPDRLIPLEVRKAQAAYNKARAAYNKARVAYHKAQAAYNKAWAAYNKAWVAYYTAQAAYDWEAIYAQVKLANSPWDGRTIFSRGKGIEAIL